jgi:hypothetical protein
VVAGPLAQAAARHPLSNVTLLSSELKGRGTGRVWMCFFCNKVIGIELQISYLFSFQLYSRLISSLAIFSVCLPAGFRGHRLRTLSLQVLIIIIHCNTASSLTLQHRQGVQIQGQAKFRQLIRQAYKTLNRGFCCNLR